ncbi:MAG: NAD(P)H-hydrate dehydratase [Planctomycetota bacterium]
MGTLPDLPARDVAGHKGTFGTVVVVGGSCGDAGAMIGAPALTANAALRSGAGLAKLVVPRPIMRDAIQLAPSATAMAIPVDDAGAVISHKGAEILDGAMESADVVAIGPGLGKGAESLVLRAVGQTDVPVVVDADALNTLAGMSDFGPEIRAAAIFTPHPGEYARLAGALAIRENPVDPAGRCAAAEALAQRLGVIVVLKGAGTVVSDGVRTWVCKRGHACLATAGTGDVLTGVIAGLVSQFGSVGLREIRGVALPRPPGRPLDLFECARIGVEAHAIAGEMWAGERGASAGLLASELADVVPRSLESLRAAQS